MMFWFVTAGSGTIVAGARAPLNAGTPTPFQGGAWIVQTGEFAPARTVTGYAT